jgi:hypothetical protein
VVVGSVLFGEHSVAEPDYFADLNLDQLALAQSDPAVAAYFRHAPRDVELVRSRQQVFQDLERPEVETAVRGFTTSMAQTRQRLDRLSRMAHPPQADRWFLDTLTDHLNAVTAFAEALTTTAPSSTWLCALRDDLAVPNASPQRWRRACTPTSSVRKTAR